jgi:hypothetical protein
MSSNINHRIYRYNAGMDFPPMMNNSALMQSYNLMKISNEVTSKPVSSGMGNQMNPQMNNQLNQPINPQMNPQPNQQMNQQMNQNMQNQYQMQDMQQNDFYANKNFSMRGQKSPPPRMEQHEDDDFLGNL